MSQEFRIIDPRPFPSRPPRRYPTCQTEVTTFWKDGSYTKLNRFGETENRKVEAADEIDAQLKTFFEALDGLCPKQAPLVFQDLDSGEVAL